MTTWGGYSPGDCIWLGDYCMCKKPISLTCTRYRNHKVFSRPTYFLNHISCHETGTSLVPWPSLVLRLPPVRHPDSFKVKELDSKCHPVTSCRFKALLTLSICVYTVPLSHFNKLHPSKSLKLCHIQPFTTYEILCLTFRCRTSQ